MKPETAAEHGAVAILLTWQAFFLERVSSRDAQHLFIVTFGFNVQAALCILSLCLILCRLYLCKPSLWVQVCSFGSFGFLDLWIQKSFGCFDLFLTDSVFPDLV